MNHAQEIIQEQGAKPLFLRIEGPTSGGGWLDIPVFEGTKRPVQGVLDVFPGFVSPTYAYEHMALLVPQGHGADFATAALSVNGDSIELTRTSYSVLVKGKDTYEGYYMTPVKKGCRPFALICGYARMHLELFDEEGNKVGSYFAKDVACKQSDPINMENVEGMVDALTADPENNEALGWMLSDSAPSSDGVYSLIEGKFEQGASRSVPTYLSIIEDGLDAMEASLPYFRSHGASRVRRQETVVPSSQVRRMGAREFQWLATHPEVLSPTTAEKGTVHANGRHFSPARMSSSRATRTFDVYENRLCLAYLETVAANLLNLESKVRRDQDSINPMRKNGEDPSEASGILTVAIARALQSRQRENLERAEQLRVRALRLSMAFQKMLPGVARQNLATIRLMRTKIFKEIRAYSRVYTHIERFCRYGETVPGEDKIAVASLRLDRAYETYVLFRLLDWLHSKGFTPASVERPIYAGKYGYTSNVFMDAPHVCNVYHLVKGNVEVDLFHEPVISYEELASHGMPLRRMTGNSWSVYTPDFVVCITKPDGNGGTSKATFVLDAKYSRRNNVLTPRSKEEGSEYAKCVGQYLYNAIDPESMRIPDALWLLCGREDEDENATMLKVPGEPWRTQHEEAYPSGVCLLTPQHDITPLFEAMGLAKRTGEFALAESIRGTQTATPSVTSTPVETEAVPEDQAVEAISELTEPVSPADSVATSESQVLPADNEPETLAEEPKTEAPATIAPEESSEPTVPLKEEASEAAADMPTPETDKPENAPDDQPAPSPKAKKKESKKEKREKKKKEREAKSEKASKPAPKKRSQEGLSNDVLPLVEKVCEITVEKDSLFDEKCSQINFGFNYPLLRANLPSGREAKLYTKEKIGIAGSSYHVYASWRPNNVQALKRTIARAERTLAKAGLIPEKPAKASANPASADSAKKPEKALAPEPKTDGKKSSSVAEAVLEIYEATPDRDKEALFDAKRCRKDIGLSQPLLRKKATKEYKPLPGHDGIFYLEPKLPSQSNLIRRYRDRLVSRQ